MKTPLTDGVSKSNLIIIMGYGENMFELAIAHCLYCNLMANGERRMLSIIISEALTEIFKLLS